MEWEKIFENNATDKGLMSKIHKHKQLTQPNRKMGRKPREFSKQNIQMVTGTRKGSQHH